MVLAKKIFRRFDFYGRKIDLLFEESTFKTSCGMFFSFVLVVMIVAITLFQSQKILRSEIASQEFMMKPRTLNSKNDESTFHDIIVGYAFKDPTQQNTHANFSLVDHSKNEINPKVSNIDDQSFECTHMVYSGLIPRDYVSITKGMTVRCIKHKARDFLGGKRPQITVQKN